MAVLSDAFVASEAEVGAALSALSEQGPATYCPTGQAKNVDPVKLGTLEAILAGYEPYALAEVVMESMQESVVDLGDDQEIFRVRGSLITGLASLPDEELERVAAVWAATAEWGQRDQRGREAFPLRDVSDYLFELRELAARSQREGKHVYMWMAL